MSAMDIPARKVLVVAQRPSDFSEMRRAIDALHRLGWRVGLIYFCPAPPSPEEARLFEELEGRKRNGTLEDYQLVGGGSSGSSGTRLAKPVRRARNRLPEWARRVFLTVYRLIMGFISNMRSAVRVIRLYFHNQRAIGSVIDRFRPDAILLPEDIVGPVLPLVIKAGHDRNLPSVILPYTIANQQEAFRSLSSNPVYQFAFLPNRLIGLVFPRWVMRQDGRALVRLPAPYIVGQVLTRTSPPDPWMMNSGFANAVAVENQAMLDYYRDAGLPLSKLKVVGAVYDDELAHHRANRTALLASLHAELGLVGDKPLLLVGGCPDQTKSSPPGFEFADMEEFCRRLAQTLRPLQQSYHIVVRPHPNYTEMGRIMAEEGVPCTLFDTAGLVAASDIYLAFGSATIRWAIACGIPAINYDVFHYDYSDYRGVDGVVHLNRLSHLTAILPTLAPGRPELADLQSRIAGSAPRWGMLDGRSTLRIAELINGFCSLPVVTRTAK
ncbi:hypothetical protein [Devosia ginsengisoli]|uniref:UDP-glycosyltransferase n=1 Tax=Devosia ginsengisoli TaxID=400770 RepID=A0A5B8LTM2_9HYPH|nr:hypothetical protein [Devosia ginsengisoli]QDZ11617.1 hypothetical protein FPZ08_13140 [Devosia ginsengisoli]